MIDRVESRDLYVAIAFGATMTAVNVVFSGQAAAPAFRAGKAVLLGLLGACTVLALSATRV